MRKMEKKLLPVLAGLLFIVHTYWMFWYHLSMLVFAFFMIPIYLFLAVMLFRRHRGGLLAMALGLMMLARVWSFNTLWEMESLPQAWTVLSAAYLAGTALLLVFVLTNSVYLLRRFRYAVNRLWFLPGVVMLAAFVWCSVSTQAYLEQDYFSLRTWILSASNLFCCPMTDALAVLMVGRWVAVSAEDALQPYLSMRGNIISEEEFQAKKRELGLQRLRS